MSAIRAERDYVVHEDFMKVIFLASSNCVFDSLWKKIACFHMLNVFHENGLKGFNDAWHCYWKMISICFKNILWVEKCSFYGFMKCGNKFSHFSIEGQCKDVSCQVAIHCLETWNCIYNLRLVTFFPVYCSRLSGSWMRRRNLNQVPTTMLILERTEIQVVNLCFIS